jgi:chromosome segregation protein
MPSRLKYLELQGYKTFASRTVFEFADTITAIVGPNGSGKSNITDSLRWVLGEQSYSLLRGKKTEDMIFSGSQQRSRAGMASATVVFDNSDGWLPIDFSEVAVSRRAYRDGQNEYLINKQRVRLKDVSELLAQSGLAERTYTVIGQGLVDAALALKADERRRLFEEAAGTGLHRSRREEAIRRLETTQRNLERVQDILAELRPRLRSLERQARRAREYEQVKADLRVLLIEWYGYHWHHAQRVLSEARVHVRERERILKKAHREQETLDEKLSALRDRIQSLRASLNSWHRQIAQLHTHRESLSRELAVADERMHSLQVQKQNATDELLRLEEELTLLQEQLDQAHTNVQRRQAELEQASSQAEDAQKSLQEHKEQRSRLEGELNAVRQELTALNSRQGKLQARWNERLAQTERSQKEYQDAEQGLAQIQGQLKESRANLQRLEAKLEQTRKARDQAQADLQAHRQEAERAELALKDAREAHAALATGLARQKAQLDVLEQAEQALSGYAGGTQTLIDAARKSRLSGTRGAFNNHLQVPAELETAIAAALGEFLDSVIIEDQPWQALDMLNQQAQRGVLLPLKSLKPGDPVQGTPSQPVEQDGILGVASQLVKSPPEFQPAVDLLLGQVLVVRDRSSARRVLSKLPPHGRAVTLAGEVFLASGPVLAGGVGREGEGGQTILSRQRQQREAKQAVAEIEKRLAGQDERLKALEKELLVLRAREQELGQIYADLSEAERKAAVEFNQAQISLERSEHQVEWQEQQRQRLSEEVQRGEAEAAQIKQELADLEEKINLSREQVRERAAAVNGLTLTEFQAQVGHWNTQAAVAERALADGKARLHERKAALERAQGNRSSLQQRLAEIEESIGALEVKKQSRRKEEIEVAAEIEAVRALIEPAEAELESAEEKQASQQKAETTARQAVSSAEHHHAQARINFARRQETLESLRQRIEDDFGLVAFEYAEDVSGPTPLPLGGMVQQLPRVDELSPDIGETIKRQRAQLRRMGAINPEAQTEYQEVKERFQFLTDQVADLEKAEVDVRKVIAELDAIMEREFKKTFDAVAEEFKEIFTRLFGGGSARLVLTDPDELTDTGIDIEAQLPGRRKQGLSLLSGGERSLTATALVFSLLKISPTPFCVLDEVDAMLDEANVGRFRELLRELSQNTQFVVVTHNRNTVQAADVIYGVTMSRDSASQVISLRLDEVSKVVD